jgi:hypothetical protein
MRTRTCKAGNKDGELPEAAARGTQEVEASRAVHINQVVTDSAHTQPSVHRDLFVCPEMPGVDMAHNTRP